MSEKQYENMDLENQLHEFLGNQVEQKFVALMERLESANVYVPAMPPENMTPEMLERVKSGENIASTPGMQPQPFLLRKNDGTTVLPIFTAKEQIPEEKRTPVLLYLPYAACVSLVMNNQDKIQEIALNPFTEGLTINKPPIEVAYRRMQAKSSLEAEAAKTVQMTAKEFKRLVNGQVAAGILPVFFLENPEKAMEQFLEKKEAFLLEIFASLYPKNNACDYEEDDFSVLTMNVSDTLQIVRIDLPPVKPEVGSALRIYLAWKPAEELRYYVVQRTEEKEKNRIVRIYQDKHQEILMSLDDYGSEISEIMELAEK